MISLAGGEFSFTFVVCFWLLLLNQNPLDVVISKGFTAAVCGVRGAGEGRRDLKEECFPVDFQRCRGRLSGCNGKPQEDSSNKQLVQGMDFLMSSSHCSFMDKSALCELWHH